MGYEKTAHTQRNERLRSTDASRFSQVSLTVTRGQGELLTWSVVVRTVGGGYLTDKRMLTGSISGAHGSPASVDFMSALQRALEAATPRPTV